VVRPIAERAETDHLREGWTDQVSTNASALMGDTSATGYVVLAEESWVQWLDWKLPTEVRIGTIVPGWPPEHILRREDDPLEKPSSRWWHRLAREYGTSSADGGRLIVVQQGYRMDTPGNRWLAINPGLARGLGWTLDPEGTFRWRNADGDVMVESVWWEDGYAQQRPPHFEDEVAYGWLVQATPEAWAAIRAAYRSPLTRCIRVVRTAQKQPDRYAVAQNGVD